jgi:hypothetical protein
VWAFSAASTWLRFVPPTVSPAQTRTFDALWTSLPHVSSVFARAADQQLQFEPATGAGHGRNSVSGAAEQELARQPRPLRFSIVRSRP